MKEGIVVASDQTLEWALPWWWEHYQKKNHLPVAFIDLGLSMKKKQWCKARGHLLSLRMAEFLKPVDSEIAAEWLQPPEALFWMSRNAWFQKPYACLLSPFEKSLWLDVDCEVRGSLSPLFERFPSSGFAAAIDQGNPKDPYPMYNSGVFLFSQSHALLHQWAQLCERENHRFAGDQEALSYLLYQEKIPIDELDEIYNYSRCRKELERAVILHWHDKYGKMVIRHAIESLSK